MPPIIPSLGIDAQNSNINLDISGVAGFFGGDAAVAAMSTVHVYEGRKWLGWYNTPGSYEIAKQYGQLPRARFWDGLYPGPNLTPAKVFGLDGSEGSRYRGLQSGTIMAKTGHIANLFQQHCDELKPQEWGAKGFRVTSKVNVSIAYLDHEPPSSLPPLRNSKTRVRKTALVAIIPIFASVATCVACALYEDWICFAMILTGILANGLSCYWIGSGTLTFTRPKPANGAPPAHGILNDGEQIIILKGPEGAVNAVTRGAFSLDYGCGERYHRIGLCALLLTTQFLAQLLLLPQGTNFGQIMFLTSLAVSWVYNIYLSSLDRDSIKRRILMKKILQEPRMAKYTLGTRTAMAVFVLLVLAERDGAHQKLWHPVAEQDEADSKSLQSLFDELLPNDTPTWRVWKDATLRKVLRYHRGASMSELGVRAIGQPYSPKSPALIDALNGDVDAAFCAYQFLRRNPITEVPMRSGSEDSLFESPPRRATCMSPTSPPRGPFPFPMPFLGSHTHSFLHDNSSTDTLVTSSPELYPKDRV